MQPDRKMANARAPRKHRTPVEQIDGRRKAPLLWADTLAGILGAMEGEITPPRRSLAHTAASLTIRLGEIDAAVAEGRPIAADHVRLAGQLNRTLRSLGIVEGAPLSSPSAAQVGAGAPSAQKNLPPILNLREEMEIAAAERIAAMPPGQRRAHTVVAAGSDHVAAVRASTAVAIATATPKQAEMFRLRLLALDEAEGRAKPDLPNEIHGKKSFTAHRDTPRRDE